jgi:hypothetical protein
VQLIQLILRLLGFLGRINKGSCGIDKILVVTCTEDNDIFLYFPCCLDYVSSSIAAMVAVFVTLVFFSQLFFIVTNINDQSADNLFQVMR